MWKIVLFGEHKKNQFMLRIEENIIGISKTKGEERRER
jgi:hypothetical protein